MRRTQPPSRNKSRARRAARVAVSPSCATVEAPKWDVGVAARESTRDSQLPFFLMMAMGSLVITVPSDAVAVTRKDSSGEEMPVLDGTLTV